MIKGCFSDSILARPLRHVLIKCVIQDLEDEVDKITDNMGLVASLFGESRIVCVNSRILDYSANMRNEVMRTTANILPSCGRVMGKLEQCSGVENKSSKLWSMS